MKVATLIEITADDYSAFLRKLALRLQADILDQFDDVIDDVKLNYVKTRYETKGIELQLVGKLLDFYIDIAIANNNCRVSCRTNVDVFGDSSAYLATSDLTVSVQELLKFMSSERIIKNLLELGLKDTAAYNMLWFDKIANELPPRYSFFAKNIVVHETDCKPIVTSQILEQDMGKTIDRSYVNFCKKPTGGYGYFMVHLLETRWVDTIEELHKFLEDMTNK